MGAFADSWLDAPFAYPRDASYIAAARRVRETRWAWFAAVRSNDVGNFETWRRAVERAAAANQAAIQLAREEEDRILAEQAVEREANRIATLGDRARVTWRGGAR